MPSFFSQPMIVTTARRNWRMKRIGLTHGLVDQRVPEEVQSLSAEQPNEDCIDEAAVATTVRGDANAGMNWPEKQA